MFRKLGMFDRSLGMFQPSRFTSQVFSPAQLFAAGEQGAWYDPSDFSSMFQDSAGTTPVTAIEQPVGKILDKSGRGNHASQSITTSRPTLRNLYNLLQRTEEFDVVAAWPIGSLGSAIDANTTTSPIGTLTADTLKDDNAGTTGIVGIATSPTISSSGTYVFSVYVKKNQLDWIQLLAISYTSPANGGVYFDLTNGAVGTANTGFTGSISNVGNGWYRCSIQFTLTTDLVGQLRIYLANADNNNSILRNGTKSVYIWGASLVALNEFSIPYQRVVTNTLGSGVYDTDLTKFKPYLFFDGTDDWLQTANINFSATDNVSVFTGLRKLSDAAQDVVVELSATIISNNGTFLLSAPSTSAANYSFSSKGTSQVDNTVTTFAAPITNVVTGMADISSPVNTIRVNGSATTLTTSQGTGNYGAAYPLYIGRRGGTTLSFVGRIYSLIVRGALTSGTQLTNTESWVNSKTGAY